MTATHAPAAPTPRERPQWLVVGRLLAGEGLRHLLWAVAVMVAVVLVGGLVARWQGWEVVPPGAGPDELLVGVSADGDGVRIVLSWVVVVVGAGIAAIVNVAVLAARTRVLVAAGATRRSVAAGLVLAAVTMTAVLLVLALGVLLVVDGGAGPLRLLVRLAGGLLLGAAAAMLVVALFQRWHWWVGTVVLALLVWVTPGLLAIAFPPVWAQVEAAAGWWGWELALAPVVLAVYWRVARRVPVP